MAEQDDMQRYTPPRRLKLFGIIAVIILVCIVAFGIISRSVASQRLAANSDAQSVPVVNIVKPSQSGARDLALPGQLKAFYEAPIYAQTSGYLQNWYADIGAPVKAGQLLALIETPDLDQQLIQAQADLETALANERLSATTAARWNGLLRQDAVSQQDADDKNGDLQAKRAQVDAARANVERLQAEESFKRIVAPFDGVVTSRSTDIGDLVAVGGASQTPLFTVDDEHRLRIYVSVPQEYAAEVKPGMTATFTVPEYPNRKFTATLATTADAIAAVSGTLLIQFQIPNADLMLQPGDYAQVHIALPVENQAISVPASALMFRDSGMVAAVLGPDNKVILKQVTIGRDLGTTIEISSGLGKNDKVINNPPDSIRQGDLVQPASSASPSSQTNTSATQ